MATYNDSVRARIDSNVKQSAEEVLRSIGMEPSDAIRLFYQQIANRGEFPLELRTPNAKTIAAMNAEAEPEIYASAIDLFNSAGLTNVQDSGKKTVQKRPKKT